MSIDYIKDDAQLNDFCQRISHVSWLAIDTEFLREKTYSAQLCLIQVASDELIACIDPLTINDLTPLFDVLYKPSLTLVFHAARQDLELFYQYTGALPPHVFDTQIAATVLGFGEQIGYGNLVKQCLNVDLDKAHSRTDWSQRPLDPDQIEYAADDVRYLRDVYHLLCQQLNEKNRTSWLKEDFATLSNPALYQIIPADCWKRVKGYGRLKGVQLAILQKLAEWRELKASETDRPRRWILNDDIMLDLAKLMPTNSNKLRLIRGLDEKTMARDGERLLALIVAAKQLPETEWPVVKQVKLLTSQQDAIVDVLLAMVRKLCDEQAIAPSAVASRKDIERLVSGQEPCALLEGWRYEIVGHYLTAFLQGKLTIQTDSQQLKLIQG